MIRSPVLLAALLTLFFTSVAHAEDAAPGGTFSAAFSSFTGSPSLAGSWRVVSEGDSMYIELADDFRARSAPDLKLFLSPLVTSKITGDTATEGSLRLGLLKGIKGKQRYEIPAGADLADYRAVLVHCEEYSKLWGASALH